jgi:Zn finger protein HypA/HybF involved in hydrogenase expression
MIGVCNDCGKKWPADDDDWKCPKCDGEDIEIIIDDDKDDEEENDEDM